MNHHQPSHVVRTKHEVPRGCLEDILFMLNPAQEDTLTRQNIINQLTSILQSVPSLQCATVKPFGSFASNLYSKWGDIDISIELSVYPNNSTSQAHKRNLLRNIQRALRRKGFGHTFQYIPMAKVPVLMFKCGYPTISCDISIDNYQGCIKSKFFLWLSQMDGRFRGLVLLIKEWAKAYNINNPKSGTLNSFALCLLIIFHLQTCRPAILPPLREIYDGKLVSDSDAGSIFMVPEKVIEEKCLGAATRFRTKNRDPLHELLISFFEKFSGIGTWASQYVVCTYSGKLEAALSKSQWTEKTYELQVEDPFEQINNNAARTVSSQGLISISNAFVDTHQKLSSFATLTDRERLLQCLVRPEIIRHLSSSSQQHTNYTRFRSRNYSRVQSNNYSRVQSSNYTSIQPQVGGYFNTGRQYLYNRAANFPDENRPSSLASSSRTSWNPTFPDL